MAKTKKFKELTEQEFEALTPEQQNMYLVDLDAFEKSKGKGDEDEEVEETLKEKAEKFFKANPEFPYASAYFTTDGVVFHGDLKGKNLVENYCKGSDGVTYKEFLKD
jgi:hypothetical protein